jgi:hypothetical protein
MKHQQAPGNYNVEFHDMICQHHHTCCNESHTGIPKNTQFHSAKVDTIIAGAEQQDRRNTCAIQSQLQCRCSNNAMYTNIAHLMLVDNAQSAQNRAFSGRRVESVWKGLKGCSLLDGAAAKGRVLFGNEMQHQRACFLQIFFSQQHT